MKKKIQITVAGNSGYCAGAKRAVDMVETALLEHGKVVTLGSIVHNPQVQTQLKSRGAKCVQSPNDVSRGEAVVIRAHGTSPVDIDILKSNGACILDATCHNVRAIHRHIRNLQAEGVTIFLAAHADHPEAKAHIARAGSDVVLVGSPEEAASVPVPAMEARCALLAQTSFDRNEFREIAGTLSSRCGVLEVINTLCGYMRDAQEAATKLARRTRLMIVLGGKNSANTRMLDACCREAGAKTIYVESADELSMGMFENASEVGLAAGASTPPESIVDVVNWFENNFDFSAEDLQSET